MAESSSTNYNVYVVESATQTGAEADAKGRMNTLNINYPILVKKCTYTTEGEVGRAVATSTDCNYAHVLVNDTCEVVTETRKRTYVTKFFSVVYVRSPP